MKRAIGAGWVRLVVGCIVAALVVSGCAVNPATGNRQLMLITEDQEIAMGREAHEQILAQMGVYPNEVVQRYVSRLGLELAALSERPHLPWTFTVIDDPTVNAFALPGGFIYVTRGIMGHLNSEAELVSVLGHEIGHVTARHGASRMSKAQLAEMGLGVGMVVSPEFRHLGDLAQQGLGLLFLKYSRDDERQADSLGFRYTVAGGWDAREMPKVFAVLKRVSEVAGAGRLPNWLATHPDPGERQERARAALEDPALDFSSATVNRTGYIEGLDGMVFGANPREGYFDESVFLHPELEFRVDFPAGWKTQNQKQQVAGMSEEQDAMVVLTLAQEADPEAAAREFLGQDGLSAGRLERGRIHGNQAALADFEVPREGQSNVRGQVAFVRYGSNTYRLLGYTVAEAWDTHGRPINLFLMSFQQLTDRRALNVQPARLQVVTPTSDLSLERFQQKYPSSVSLETLGLINQVGTGGVLQRGMKAKRIVGGPMG